MLCDVEIYGIMYICHTGMVKMAV